MSEDWHKLVEISGQSSSKQTSSIIPNLNNLTKVLEREMYLYLAE
jgi:hypothetical protein